MAKKIGVVRIERFDFEGRNVFLGMLGQGNQPIKMPLIDALGEIETLKKERRTDVKIISPRVADYLMMGDTTFCGRVPEQSVKFWRRYALGGFPTDVWIVYERENRPFGEVVAYDRHIRNGHRDKPPLKCNIPPIFQGGVGNDVLAQMKMKLGDIDVKTMTLILDPARLIQFRDFARGMAGMHSIDYETTVPSGKEYQDWEQSREEKVSLRSHVTTFAESYIEFVSRFAAMDGVERQRICMTKSIFDNLNIVLEIPEAVLGKFR